MIYLHKILPVFLSPIFIVLFILAVAAVKRSRVWMIMGACLLYGLSTPMASDRLFNYVESKTERLAVNEMPRADAIVVLSAGMSWLKVRNGYITQWPTPNRFFSGVELLRAEKAPLLIFTGAKLPWQQGDQTEGDVLKHYAQLMQMPPHQILVTDKVENTEQEAAAVKKMLASLPQQIILVTSAFHMKRAQLLFEKQGFTVLPYSVDFYGQGYESTSFLMSLLPNPDALSYTSIALRELLGRLYYRLRQFVSL